MNVGHAEILDSKNWPIETEKKQSGGEEESKRPREERMSKKSWLISSIL